MSAPQCEWHTLIRNDRTGHSVRDTVSGYITSPRTSRVAFGFNPFGKPVTITGPQAPSKVYERPHNIWVTFEEPGDYTWTITNEDGTASATVRIT